MKKMSFLLVSACVCLYASGEGFYYMAGVADRTLYAYDTESSTSSEVGALEMGKFFGSSFISSLVVRPDTGSLYLFASNNMYIWDLDAGLTERISVEGVAYFAGRAVFSSDGKYIYTPAGMEKVDLSEHMIGIRALVLDPDTGEILGEHYERFLNQYTAVFGTPDNNLYYWRRNDDGNPEIMDEFRGHHTKLV